MHVTGRAVRSYGRQAFHDAFNQWSLRTLCCGMSMKFKKAWDVLMAAMRHLQPNEKLIYEASRAKQMHCQNVESGTILRGSAVIRRDLHSGRFAGQYWRVQSPPMLGYLSLRVDHGQLMHTSGCSPEPIQLVHALAPDPPKVRQGWLTCVIWQY
jgi:hypothetical protein